MNLTFRIPSAIFLVVHVLGISGETCRSEFKDVSSCTILSDIVFEGQPDVLDLQGSQYNVTFQVRKLLKGTLRQNANGKYVPIVVGIFGREENTDECIAGPVKPGTKYLVFLKVGTATGVDGEYYRLACTSPVVASKKNSKEAKISACPKCGKQPTVKLSPAKEIKVNVGSTTQVTCNHQGHPQPKVIWYKNGKQLNSSNRIQVKSVRRSSKIIIKKVTAEDQGFYECQAVNVLGASPRTGVSMTVTTSKPSRRLRIERCVRTRDCV